MNFNSRTHEGYDPRLHSFLNIFSYFNPRTREGYDYSLGTFLFCLYSFNPRIHKGYDKAHQKRKNKLSALIPIPTKGTMPGSFKRVFNYKCFNLRTREGYDNIIFASSNYVEHFNPRTREGYDRYRLAGPPQMYSFNPHTHKKYDQPISGTDRLMYALIPVPMKGTIMIFLQMKSYPLIALIPVPAKGTI